MAELAYRLDAYFSFNKSNFTLFYILNPPFLVFPLLIPPALLSEPLPLFLYRRSFYPILSSTAGKNCNCSNS